MSGWLLRCGGRAALSIALPLLVSHALAGNDFALQPDTADWSHGVRLRPNAGGAADTVEFGMLVKNFFGADIKGSTFFVDLVVTQRWVDRRAEIILPANLSKVSMASEGAAELIWMPDVTIANRDLGGLETVSSATIVTRGGRVERIERFLARVKTSFDIRAFPFDRQDLPIRIVSASLMADALVLAPIKGGATPTSPPPRWSRRKVETPDVPAVSGVDNTSFAGSEYAFEGFKLRAFLDIDGSLAKSRGELVVTVRRNGEAYTETIFYPAFLLLGLSWTAFFFPLLPAFAMPRVATTVIAFLTLMTLASRVDGMLPSTSTLCWVDVFLEVTQLLMFGCIAFNVTEQYIYNHLHDYTLANKLGHELILFFPFLSVTAMCYCFSVSDGQHLERARRHEHWWLLTGTAAYIVLALARYWKETAKEVDGDAAGVGRPRAATAAV